MSLSQQQHSPDRSTSKSAPDEMKLIKQAKYRPRDPEEWMLGTVS